jgi:hypothetical protein
VYEVTLTVTDSTGKATSVTGSAGAYDANGGFVMISG